MWLFARRPSRSVEPTPDSITLHGRALPLLGTQPRRLIRTAEAPPGRRLRIAVDVASAESGLASVIAGALAALDRMDVLLVGPAAAMAAHLGPLPPGVELLDAPEVIGMAEDPVAAVRTKRGSSVMLASEAVARGAADAMVSSGNAGAVVLAAAARLRRLPGVLAPALATLLPVLGGGATVLLDVGAATAAPPEWLVHFAALGRAYATARLGLASPRIGLISNGHEEIKGGQRQRGAHEQLGEVPGYIGQIEAYDLLSGRVDVAVTDGFTGDVLLKMHERTLDASAVTVAATLRRGAGSPAALVESIVDEMWSALSPEVGAVLLGVRGVCVKCHGAAPAHDITEAMWLAAECVRVGVTARIAAGLGPEPVAIRG